MCFTHASYGAGAVQATLAPADMRQTGREMDVAARAHDGDGQCIVGTLSKPGTAVAGRKKHDEDGGDDPDGNGHTQ